MEAKFGYTSKDIAKYFKHFLDNINNGDEIEIRGVGKVILNREHYDELINYLSDQKVLAEILKNYNDDTYNFNTQNGNTTKKYKFYPQDGRGDGFIWTQVVKSQYSGVTTRKTYNVGDVAEGIFGAGLAAKFIAIGNSGDYDFYEGRPSRDIISVQDIKDFLVRKTANETRPLIQLGNNNRWNVNNNTIIFNLQISENNYRALVDPDIWISDEKLTDIFHSVVDYVNSDKVDSNIRLFFNNLTVNPASKRTALISSEGIADQRGTKADIVVSFKDDGDSSVKQIMLNASVKTNSQNLAQHGIKIGSVDALFKKFGVDIKRLRATNNLSPNIVESYERFSSTPQLVDWFSDLFNAIRDDLENKLRDRNYTKTLSSAIYNLAALSDPTIKVIYLKGRRHVTQSPSKIENALVDIPLFVSMSERERPSIMVYTAKTKDPRPKPNIEGKLVEFTLEVRKENGRDKVNKIHVYKGKFYDQIVNED